MYSSDRRADGSWGTTSGVPSWASPLIEKNIANTSCGINAYEPSISGGRVNGSALIDCNGKNYQVKYWLRRMVDR
jgi:hypothetical protein